MGRAAILSGVCALAIATPVAAQARPDFSGRWTSEPEAAAQRGGQAEAGRAAGGGAGAARGGAGGRGGAAGGRSGEMGSGWGPTITVTQDGLRLTIEYAYFSRADLQPPLRYVYALDGSETKNSFMMGRGIQEETSRTSWDGDRLVITTDRTFPHPETGQPVTNEVRRTLSLESAGALVVEATIGGVLGGPSTTTRTVYRRS